MSIAVAGPEILGNATKSQAAPLEIVAQQFATYFDVTIDVPTLVALLVCLIPNTIGALLAAIGIAGIARPLHRSTPE